MPLVGTAWWDDQDAYVPRRAVPSTALIAQAVADPNPLAYFPYVPIPFALAFDEPTQRERSFLLRKSVLEGGQSQARIDGQIDDVAVLGAYRGSNQQPTPPTRSLQIGLSSLQLMGDANPLDAPVNSLTPNADRVIIRRSLPSPNAADVFFTFDIREVASAVSQEADRVHLTRNQIGDVQLPLAILASGDDPGGVSTGKYASVQVPVRGLVGPRDVSDRLPPLEPTMQDDGHLTASLAWLQVPVSRARRLQASDVLPLAVVVYDASANLLAVSGPEMPFPKRKPIVQGIIPTVVSTYDPSGSVPLAGMTGANRAAARGAVCKTAVSHVLLPVYADVTLAWLFPSVDVLRHLAIPAQEATVQAQVEPLSVLLDQIAEWISQSSVPVPARKIRLGDVAQVYFSWSIDAALWIGAETGMASRPQLASKIQGLPTGDLPSRSAIEGDIGVLMSAENVTATLPVRTIRRPSPDMVTLSPLAGTEATAALLVAAEQVAHGRPHARLWPPRIDVTAQSPLAAYDTVVAELVASEQELQGRPGKVATAAPLGNTAEVEYGSTQDGGSAPATLTVWAVPQWVGLAQIRFRERPSPSSPPFGVSFPIAGPYYAIAGQVWAAGAEAGQADDASFYP
jgi:hypothetical protein